MADATHKGGHVVADNDDLEDSEDNEPTPKDLRAQIKKANKTISDLTEQLSGLAKKDRQRTISDLLTEKGLSTKVAALLPDTIDADPSSIDAWLTEYQDVFGAPKSAEGAEDGGANVDDETKAAQGRLAAATAGALPEGKAADIATRIANATTADELTAVLASA